MKFKLLTSHILLLTVLFGCGQKVQPPSGTVPQGVLPDQIIEGFTLVETENGKKQWTLSSRKASNYEKQKAIIIEGVNVDFYRENEDLYSTLTAESGTMNTTTNDMEARGHVLVVSKDGARLETNQLRWDNTRQKIVSDEFVRITRGKTVMTGIGLESDPSLEHVVIKEKFKAHAEPDKKGAK